MFVVLIASLPHYGIEITEESIADAKEAVTDYYNGGVEQEWEKESHWRFWEEMSPEWYLPDGRCLKKIKDFES